MAKKMMKDMLELSLIPAFGGAAMSAIHNSDLDTQQKNIMGSMATAGMVGFAYKKIKK